MQKSQFPEIICIEKVSESDTFFVCKKGTDMAKDFAKSFYNSAKWNKCKDSYIAKRIMIDGGLCEECHDRVGYIVHHKVKLTAANISNPDISLNHDNLEYVCKQCHDEFEGHGLHNHSKKLLFAFDENGQPVKSFRSIDSPH